MADLPLAIDQPLERKCDLPFLIALGSGRQPPGFSHKLPSGLYQLADIEKVWMPWHSHSRLDQAGELPNSQSPDAVTGTVIGLFWRPERSRRCPFLLTLEN
jgi:hypothetical protein